MGEVPDRPLRSERTTVWWMVAAFGAASVLAASVLAIVGPSERGTDIALQVTARLSFLLFCAAYAGSAMAVLFGARFRLLKQNGRNFGLAFASAHLVHVGLVIWLCWIGAAPVLGVFLFFGPALIFTYLLALCSIRRFQQMLGTAGWWFVRTVGMNYIAYAFAADFLRYPLWGSVKHIVEYAPFAALSIIAPVLYCSALALPPLRKGWAYLQRRRFPA